MSQFLPREVYLPTLTTNVNAVFDILVNHTGNPIDGAFIGLDEGSDYATVDGWKFRISYQGGSSGQDVTLQVVREPNVWGHVFDDHNHDGVVSAGESYLDAVTVALLDGSGNFVTSTYTINGGYYAFDPVAAGNYSVQVTPPLDYIFTAQGQGDNPRLASAVNPSTGQSDALTLVDETTSVYINAGLFRAVSLTSSVNPSTYGQSVTFIATVAGNHGTPTGTVTLFDGDTALETKTLSAGSATFTTAALSVDDHALTAEYQSGAASEVLTQTVNAAASSVVLTSSLASPSFGQTVTFTLTAAANTFFPTGEVIFYDGDALLGIVDLDAGGAATFTTATLAAGNHTFTAAYSGDESFLGSTSDALTLTIHKADSSIALTSSASSSSVGQELTLTATVTSGGGTPTGTVDFYDGGTKVGTVSLDDFGSASFVTTSLADGSHSLTAVYHGDANFNTSTASALTQTVITPVPVVAWLSDSSGFTGGNETITLIGSGFTNASAVSFGSTGAASFVVQDDETIVAVVPAHAAGIVDVQVTTSGGTSSISASDAFEFVPLQVTSVAPTATGFTVNFNQPFLLSSLKLYGGGMYLPGLLFASQTFNTPSPARSWSTRPKRPSRS